MMKTSALLKNFLKNERRNFEILNAQGTYLVVTLSYNRNRY